MNRYTVTIQLSNKDAFQHFIDNVGPVAGRLVVSVEPGDDAEADAPAPEPVAKARAPRGSKVNDTIKAALKGGAKTVKELKEALEGVNLSAGSLSTGIATLQREGVIERVGEGTYGLASDLKQAA